MADLQETMGTVIRRERRQRGLTLKQLAERAMLSVVYIGELERGKKYPSAVVLERLPTRSTWACPTCWSWWRTSCAASASRR